MGDYRINHHNSQPLEKQLSMAAGNLYTTDNPVFASFCFYAALVALKMLMMSFLTAYHRLTKNIFANPEDAAMSKVKVRTDESVERVKGASQRYGKHRAIPLHRPDLRWDQPGRIQRCVLLPSVCRLPHGSQWCSPLWSCRKHPERWLTS